VLPGKVAEGDVRQGAYEVEVPDHRELEWRGRWERQVWPLLDSSSTPSFPTDEQ
jgi:hypothetical protein